MTTVICKKLLTEVVPCLGIISSTQLNSSLLKTAGRRLKQIQANKNHKTRQLLLLKSSVAHNVNIMSYRNISICHAYLNITR